MSQSYHTLTSTVSTITGTYANTHGISNRRQKLSPSLVTVAEIFRSAGYKTFYNGGPNIDTIMDLSGGRRGYDSVDTWNNERELMSQWSNTVEEAMKNGSPFFVHLYNANLHLPYLIEYNRVPIVSDLKPPVGFPVTQKELDRILSEYLVSHYREFFTNEAIRLNSDLFVNTQQHREEIFALFQMLQYPSDWPFLRSRWMALYRAYVEAIRKAGKQGTEYVRLLYDTKVSDVDRVIGSIIDLIQTSRVSDKTIIVITSAHGEEFDDHGNFSHEGGNYNELIKTPLIIVYPHGSRMQIEKVTQNIDIFPTLLEMTGLSIPLQIQGKSLVSLMNGREDGIERFGVSEFDESGASIQNQRWKLIVSSTDRKTPSFELYDLIQDPQEQHNIADQEKATVGILWETLKKTLHQSQNKTLRALPPVFPSGMDEETRKRLEKGGYF